MTAAPITNGDSRMTFIRLFEFGLFEGAIAHLHRNLHAALDAR